MMRCFAGDTPFPLRAAQMLTKIKTSATLSARRPGLGSLWTLDHGIHDLVLRTIHFFQAKTPLGSASASDRSRDDQTSR